MGSFPGHALPGSFFAIFGLWHLINVSVKFFRGQKGYGPPFRSSTYFSLPCCSRFPSESTVKLISLTIGITVELGSASHHWAYAATNGQHICMYGGFAFASLVEILEFYRVHVPDGTVHVLYALSFFIEGLLFYWHMQLQAPLEVQVHTLLVYIIAACIVTVMVEMKLRHHVLPALLRSALIIFQGIWFWQIAFILYPPSGMTPWDWQSHEQMMIVTILFCLELLGILIFSMGCWFLVAYRYGMVRDSAVGPEKIALQPDEDFGAEDEICFDRSRYSRLQPLTESA